MLTRCMFCGEKAARRCRTGDCRHCDACGKEFVPCDPKCPGYFLNTDKKDGCPIEICDECVTSAHPRSKIKVPHSDIKMHSLVYTERLTDVDARGWPEAYLAVAKLFRAQEREAASS